MFTFTTARTTTVYSVDHNPTDPHEYPYGSVGIFTTFTAAEMFRLALPDPDEWEVNRATLVDGILPDTLRSYRFYCGPGSDFVFTANHTPAPDFSLTA